MLKITREHRIGIMAGGNAPAACCDPGETVIFETMDCSDGAVTRDGRRDKGAQYLRNPAAGPLYVRGAHPGDLLRVRILDIKMADWGFMGTGFGCDCFRTIQGEAAYRTFDISDGFVRLGGKTFPVAPMVGVIGVAPAGAGIDTVTPLHHGGNMDCTMIGIGADVYFPVSVEGALLAIGDLHAAMGDGEVFQYGLEVAGEVTVQVDVVKNDVLRMPAVIRDGVLAVIASGDDLNTCSELAVTQMYDVLVAHGWDRTEAGYLMSMKCDLAICQTVDPKLTVRACMPTDLIQAQ